MQTSALLSTIVRSWNHLPQTQLDAMHLYAITLQLRPLRKGSDQRTLQYGPTPSTQTCCKVINITATVLSEQWS